MLYIASIIISALGITVALAMINVKSALDTWWKLASIFSGGMLGLFLLAAFAKVAHSKGAVVGILAGIVVIVWISLSPLLAPDAAWSSPFHSYFAIVLGTTAIILIGFIASVLLGKGRTKQHTQ